MALANTEALHWSLLDMQVGDFWNEIVGAGGQGGGSRQFKGTDMRMSMDD